MSEPDFGQIVWEESASRDAITLWFRQRVENIHQHVSAYDILRHGGVELRQVSDDTEEQIKCPFHGADNKPSARVYPQDGKSRSHVWCYVCQERWDALKLWQRFYGGPEKTFGRAITEIERAFHLTPPPIPKEANLAKERQGARLIEDFGRLFELCDRYLRNTKPAYKELGDMKGYLAASRALDLVDYRVTKQVITLEKGKETLRMLFDKITQRAKTEASLCGE
jgi:hypothetical protein